MENNPYLLAIASMKQMLSGSSKALGAFNRKAYSGTFQKYYDSLVPAFNAIEQLYNNVGDPETMLRNMAHAIMDETAASIKGKSRKNERDNELLNANLMLVSFAFPAILEFKGNSSQPLAEMLNACWKEAFPKTNLQVAGYEFIEKGFHRRFCYITTAVCNASGLGDNCEELMLLRDFRDGYMSRLPEGEQMIRQYYDVAPTIVKHIDRSENAQAVYDGIWNNYIRPCIGLIKEGRDEECCALYSSMVNDLKDEYFHM